RGYAALAFTLGLLGGEGGLGGLAFWFAYEMLGPKGSNRRLARCAAPVILGVAYLAGYALVLGGAREMDLYVDPLTDPMGFLEALTIRLPMLLGNVVWLADAGLGLFWPGPVIAMGIVGVVVVAWVLAKTLSIVGAHQGTALRWLVPGAVLATSGVVGGMPG